MNVFICTKRNLLAQTHWKQRKQCTELIDYYKMRLFIGTHIKYVHNNDSNSNDENAEKEHDVDAYVGPTQMVDVGMHAISFFNFKTKSQVKSNCIVFELWFGLLNHLNHFLYADS